MRIRLTETARDELEEILSYIAADNLASAGRVAAAVERTLNWIARWPAVSPVVHGDDVRSKLVLGFRVRVFYVIGNGEVIVRNIRRTRRLRPWESAE